MEAVAEQGSGLCRERTTPSSWDSLYDITDKDGDGNVVMGDVNVLDTRNCLIIGNKRLISTIGMEDCLIVETEDALRVAKKG